MKKLRGYWIDYQLLWIRHDQASKVDFRPANDVARLEFLRQKQQPEADFSVNWYHRIEWTNEQLGLEVNKNDAYEANKISTSTLDDIASIRLSEVVEYVQFWTPTRVKACLRSGKMLPYNFLRSIKPQSQWKTIQAGIYLCGELPDLDENMLMAIDSVRNEGYHDALEALMAGDVAPHTDRGPYLRQNRALDLLANILRSWEAIDQHVRT